MIEYDLSSVDAGGRRRRLAHTAKHIARQQSKTATTIIHQKSLEESVESLAFGGEMTKASVGAAVGAAVGNGVGVPNVVATATVGGAVGGRE